MSVFDPVEKPRLAGDYYEGLKHLHNGHYEAAVQCFRQLSNTTRNDAYYKSRYQAYYGLALVCSGDRTGIMVCRSASGDERHDGEVYYCLAIAETKLNNRERAVAALQRGLAIDPLHADVARMRDIMGIRRKPVLSFLDRSHPLNRLLGKLTYRRSRVAGRASRPD